MTKLLTMVTAITVITMNLSAAPVWKNYTSCSRATSLCKSSSGMWIGTWGGLVEYNSTTGAATVHTHASMGLPGNQINDIASDGSGGLWIGTTVGVCHKKSDGTMVNYADTNLSFPEGSVVAVCSEKSGGAWAIVYPEKIVHITGVSTFVTYTKDSLPSLKNTFVDDCVVDTNGTFWATISDSGLVYHDATGWKRYTMTQIAGGATTDKSEKLFVDKGNLLWIGGAYGSLWKYNGTAFVNAGKTPNDENLGAIAQNPLDDSIWVGLSSTGVTSVIEGQPWDKYVSFKDEQLLEIFDMAFSSDGKLWVATDSGAVVYQGGTWTKINHNPSKLVNNEVNCLTPDPVNGGMWAGYYDGGAAYFKDGVTTLYLSETGKLPSNNVYSIYVDGSTTWFGTSNGLASLNGTTWTVYSKAANGLLAENVTSLLKTGDTLWVAHNGKGLDVMVNGAVVKQITSTPTGLPDDDITDLGKDSSGGIWVTTDGGGLAKFDGTTWTQFKSDNSGLMNNDVRAIAVESNGTRWVGTTGLNRYSFAGTWKSWQVFIAPYYPGGLLCVDIAIDKNNLKWLAGYGLFAFDGTTYTGYKVENSGLSGNSLTCVAIDKSGSIWAGTSRDGIAVMENPPAVSVHGSSMNKTVVMVNTLSSGSSQYDILGRACLIRRSGTGINRNVAGLRIDKRYNGATKMLTTK